LPDYKKNKELENILDFVLEIGKVKKMPRLYWLAQGIKNPETVAGHIFTTTLMAWLFGKEKIKFDEEKLLKMLLFHELSAVYTGDTIPYIKKLPKDPKERKEILKKWPRLPEMEKTKRFLREYEEEKEALKRLTKNLNKDFKKEVIGLWREYRMAANQEAIFANQVNVLAVLLQGLLYQEKYKKFSAQPLWEWAFEKCDDPILLRFLDALKEKFY
jgi:putative hydrolase of HD superfamily